MSNRHSRKPVDILGSISAPTPPSSVSGGGGVASPSSGATVQANGVDTVVYRDGIQAQTGFDVIDGLDAVGSLGITTLDIPIVDGEIDLIVSLFGVIQCAGRFEGPEAPEFGGPCSASFDFLNSARLLGGQIIDASGGVVNGINVSSISGFDYLAGATPHNVSAVPLPAGAPLILTALGFLAVIRMRRTKR